MALHSQNVWIVNLKIDTSFVGDHRAQIFGKL